MWMGVYGVCERCGWGRFVCPAYLSVSANDVDGGIWCRRWMWVGVYGVCERCGWGYMVSANDVTMCVRDGAMCVRDGRCDPRACWLALSPLLCCCCQDRCWSTPLFGVG